MTTDEQRLRLLLGLPASPARELEVNQRWTDRSSYYRHRGDGGPKWTDVRQQYGFEVVRKGRSKLDDFIIRNHYQSTAGPKGVTLPVALYRKAGPAARTTLAGVAYFNFPPATKFLNQLKPTWWSSPRTGESGGGGLTRYFGPWETGGYEPQEAYVKQLMRKGMRQTEAAAKARRENRFEPITTSLRGQGGWVKRTDHLKFGEVLELTRFVLLDSVPYGGETPFLRECFKFLRQIEVHTDFMKANNLGPKKVRCILSHSDPIPVRLKSGKLTLPGHIGNIYQAHNAHYVGRSTTGIRHHLPDGSGYDGQNLSKVSRGPGTQGFDYSYHSLLTNVEGEPTGISPRRSRESWGDYVRRIRSTELENRSHPGNLVYAWAIGSSKQKKLIEKGFAKAVDAENRPIYPKRPRQKYINLWGRFHRAITKGQWDKARDIADGMGQIWPGLNTASREALSAPPLAQDVQRARMAAGSASKRPRYGYSLSQLYQQSGLRPEPDAAGEG